MLTRRIRGYSAHGPMSRVHEFRLARQALANIRSIPFNESWVHNGGCRPGRPRSAGTAFDEGESRSDAFYLSPIAFRGASILLGQGLSSSLPWTERRVRGSGRYPG